MVKKLLVSFIQVFFSASSRPLAPNRGYPPHYITIRTESKDGDQGTAMANEITYNIKFDLTLIGK